MQTMGRQQNALPQDNDRSRQKSSFTLSAPSPSVATRAEMLVFGVTKKSTTSSDDKNLMSMYLTGCIIFSTSTRGPSMGLILAPRVSFLQFGEHVM
jgi:hypothetical protein